MRVYDRTTGHEVETDRPAADHSQNPLIGIVLLLLVLWLALEASGYTLVINWGA